MKNKRKNSCIILLIFLSIKKFIYTLYLQIQKKFKKIYSNMLCLKRIRIKYKKFKRRLIKYIDIENKSQKYIDLSPVDNIDKSNTYFEALDWAINNEKVKNIALTGSYGSGKSSIIQSYIKKRPHMKYLNISLASFCEESIQSNEENNSLISFDEDKIEEGILKQLFYKVNYRKIPHSRYRKINNLKYRFVALGLMSTIFIFSTIYLIVRPNDITTIINTLVNASTILNINKLIVTGIFILFIIAALLIISYILWIIMIKFKIVKVQFTEKSEMNSEIGIEESKNTDTSVLNKNLDEILYFFEVNKYNVVFIEDLDRFENTKIFIKLRELNTLLNNYDMIKRRIVFVYAVKDDLFTKNDRTKFFDFIIPAIPIINSTNSGEKMLERLKNYELQPEFPPDFLNRISVYIDDMRILNNVFNEFYIFKNLINDIDGLRDENMFTLMIFKNLYPKEFTKLQYEQGIICDAFKSKKNFLNKCRNDYINKRKEYEKILKDIDNDYLNSLKELKVVLLYNLLENKSCFINNIYIRSINTNINFNNYMDENFSVDKLLNKELSIQYLCDGSWRNIETSLETADRYSSFSKSYIERFNYLKYSSEEKKRDLQNKIDSLKEKEHSILKYRLSDLFKEYNPKDFLSEEIVNNKFLVFALRNSYIDEYYANYINYFYPNSLTKQDMDFIMSVRNYQRLEKDYSLSKIKQVVDRLEQIEFEQKEVYNYDLLNYLLKDQSSKDKCITFIKQLSDETEESYSFIDEFIDLTDKEDIFIYMLSNYWHGFWNYVESNITFNSDRKYYYLDKILKYANIDDIVSIADESNLREFIIEDRNSLLKLSDINDDKLIEIISKLELKFKTLECTGISQDILNYIFDNSYYVINIEMIENIIKNKCPSSLEKLHTANYSSIMTSTYEPLKTYINNNLDEYIHEVFLNIDTNIHEDIENISLLINEFIDIGNLDLCKEIILKESFVVEDFNEICSIEKENISSSDINEIWNIILDNRKIKINWDTVFCYYHNWGDTKILINFIDNNMNILKKIDSSDISETDIQEFMEAMLINDFKDETYIELIKLFKIDFTNISFNGVSQEHMKILIDYRYFPLQSNYYDSIKSKYQNLHIRYLCCNKDQYLDHIDEYELEYTELLELLKSSVFSYADKLNILKEFGYSRVNEEIANIIYDYTISMDKELVEYIWDASDVEHKKILLYNQLFNQIDIFSNQELLSKFKELGGEYLELLKFGKDATLSFTDYNEKLAILLDKKDYISSWNIKKKKVPSKKNIQKENLILRVRKERLINS